MRKKEYAEEKRYPVSEASKYSRLLTPINSLIDQLLHCVVGGYYNYHNRLR